MINSKMYHTNILLLALSIYSLVLISDAFTISYTEIKQTGQGRGTLKNRLQTTYNKIIGTITVHIYDVLLTSYEWIQTI